MKVTAEQIRKRLREYDLAQATVAYFADVATSRLSRWLNGLQDLSEEEKESLDVASGALASMIHDMHDIPIDFAKVKKVEPVVRKYMRQRREFDAATK